MSRQSYKRRKITQKFQISIEQDPANGFTKPKPGDDLQRMWQESKFRLTRDVVQSARYLLF